MFHTVTVASILHCFRSLLLPFIYLRRKYCNWENLRNPAVHGPTHFAMSWMRFDYIWKMSVCQCVSKFCVDGHLLGQWILVGCYCELFAPHLFFEFDQHISIWTFNLLDDHSYFFAVCFIIFLLLLPEY